MPSQLKIRASTKEFSRYKRLVDSDWNKTTFDAVLELLWDVVGDPTSVQREPMEVLTFLRDVRNKHQASVMPEQFFEGLRFLSFVIREPKIPKTPNKFVPGTSRIEAQTGAAIVYLLLQINLQISGETGFFRDLQSLLCLHSVHYVLPQLQKAELRTAHDSLVNALVIHAFMVWRDEPSHMFYLLGAIMGQLGHTKERIECLRRSLSATPIDDHSYLTKVSAYWGELMEIGDRNSAMEFLLKLSRNVPESYVFEIGEMIKETAEFQTLTSQ